MHMSQHRCCQDPCTWAEFTHTHIKYVKTEHQFHTQCAAEVCPGFLSSALGPTIRTRRMTKEREEAAFVVAKSRFVTMLAPCACALFDHAAICFSTLARACFALWCLAFASAACARVAPPHFSRLFEQRHPEDHRKCPRNPWKQLGLLLKSALAFVHTDASVLHTGAWVVNLYSQKFEFNTDLVQPNTVTHDSNHRWQWAFFVGRKKNQT